LPKIKEDRVGRLTSGRKSETPSPVNTLEKVLSPSFSIREFVSGYLLRSQNKSSGFDAPRTKHASCRAAPAPGPFCKFTHPHPNLPMCGRRGPKTVRNMTAPSYNLKVLSQSATISLFRSYGPFVLVLR
jgi:hypothetical protein